MIHEKTFLLGTGRAVKLIVKGYGTPGESEIRTEINVLVKDPKEEYFHAPIGMSHPQFWKLKRMSSEQARQLQIAYSGILDKHINKAVKEFEEILMSSVLL